jgi:hypothetical protein
MASYGGNFNTDWTNATSGNQPGLGNGQTIDWAGGKLTNNNGNFHYAGNNGSNSDFTKDTDPNQIAAQNSNIANQWNQQYGTSSSSPSGGAPGITDQYHNTPSWLQQAQQQLVGQAQNVTGQAYTPYQQPENASTYGQDTGRVAGFSPLQQQAQTQEQQNQGNYQPYLNYASQTIPQAVGSYMSPYTDSVVNRIAQLGQRNLSENLLPQVNSTFAGNGQFGSTRNADFTNRAVRDANESILGTQSAALQNGYTQAQNTADTDLSRIGALGGTAQTYGQNDVNNLNTLGQQQQNLTQSNLNTGVSDFKDQQGYQQQQLSNMSGILNGMTNTSFNNLQDQTSPQVATTTTSTANTNPTASALTGAAGALTQYNTLQ